MRTGKTFRQHWESLDTVGRNEFLRNAGVRVLAHKDKMPPLDVKSGPMVAGEIPRTVIIDRDDLHAVIELGALRDLLAHAEAA